MSLKVLTIGLDRELFEKDSNVQRRLVDQARYVDEMHVVVFAKKSLGLKKLILGNLYIYPTNSKNKFMYFWDAFHFGKKIILNKNKQFVITAQDPYETGIVALLLSKKTKVPFQVQIHTDIFNPVFIKKPFLNRIRVFIAKIIIPKAFGVRVVCKRIKQSLVNNFGDSIVSKIQVLPVFIDLKTFLSIGGNKKNNKEVNILVVSRFEKEKNVELSIRVLFNVLQKYNSIRITIVGDGSQYLYLKNLVKKMGMKENVRFVGWQKDLATYYQEADIFLNTSNYEGYGRTLVEAAAASCAIITTDVGIVGEVLTNNKGACVCNPEDEECLSQKMIEICSDVEKRKNIAKSAHEEVLEKALFEKEIYYKKMSDSWFNLLD